LIGQGAIDAFIGRLVGEIIAKIDVMPGSDSNPVRIGPGVVPVAILSGETFDAATVDATTVLLEGAEGRVTGRGAPTASLEDFNGDGFSDLIVHVEAAALELTSTDAIAELTARAFGGRVVFGFDSIRIVRNAAG
jgi:hypothetical protein